jgi:N-acetylmuramoyl-L-alanine amidase
MRSVAISSGHGLYVRGASGYLDEVDEAIKIVDRVAVLLREAGAKVAVFHDDISRSQSENLNRIVAWHNKQSRDLDVAVHLNAYQTTSKPMGDEVLYVTQQQLASSTAAAISTAGGFINRGGKKRTDLAFLNGTSKPAILLEVCFVDSRADADLYNSRFEAICHAIAEQVGDLTVPGGPPDVIEPAPPEPSEPSPEPTQPSVDITIVSKGDVIVTINGEGFRVAGSADPEAPVPLNWQEDVETTVFGGKADPNDSAYAPYGPIDDKVLACAVPFKFVGARPQIVVRNRANGKQTIVEVLDVGPWMVDDDYWESAARPVAEICFLEKKPLPSGPNKGVVPSNRAGLDLTPAAAKAIGLEGKGQCDWAIMP